MTRLNDWRMRCKHGEVVWHILDMDFVDGEPTDGFLIEESWAEKHWILWWYCKRWPGLLWWWMKRRNP